MFPVIINAESGIRRSRVAAVDGIARHRHPHGLDRQRDPPTRVPRQAVPPTRRGGLPNADRVMEWGLVLPNNHSMNDDDCDYIGECLDAFVTEKGLA